LLYRQFPESVRDSLVKKLSCRDYEVVAFNVFQSSVYTCVVLQGINYHALYISWKSWNCPGIQLMLLENFITSNVITAISGWICRHPDYSRLVQFAVCFCTNSNHSGHTQHNTQAISALHPSAVAKSSTSFGWVTGEARMSPDPTWHLSFRSGVPCCILLHPDNRHSSYAVYRRRVGYTPPVNST